MAGRPCLFWHTNSVIIWEEFYHTEIIPWEDEVTFRAASWEAPWAAYRSVGADAVETSEEIQSGHWNVSPVSLFTWGKRNILLLTAARDQKRTSEGSSGVRWRSSGAHLVIAVMEEGPSRGFPLMVAVSTSSERPRFQKPSVTSPQKHGKGSIFQTDSSRMRVKTNIRSVFNNNLHLIQGKQVKYSH